MQHRLRLALPALLVAAGGRFVALATAQPGKITAQKAVDEVKTAHPEITGLELAATKPGSESYKTIAATEAKEVGQEVR